MGIRKSVVAAALTMACTPVVGLAQTIVFSDNFDAGTSASRYTFFSADRESTTAFPSGQFGTGTFVGDTSANFNFNYGGYTYRTTDPNDGVTAITQPIPAAPHSTGGTTVGLRFDVNNANNGSASIQAMPKLSELLGGAPISGDHKLSFDVFIDYNGHTLGGNGSTEWFIAGLNADGVNPTGPRVGNEPFGVGKGVAFAVNGEHGNGLDYRAYADNTRLDSGTLTGQRTGYVAPLQDVQPTATWGPSNGENIYYKNIFPFANGYETPGAPGKVWNSVEISQSDNIIYFTINGHLITARSNDTSNSGDVTLGYADFNNTTAALDDVTSQDANFAIFDNVVVTQLTQTRPTWNNAGGGTWSDGGKWTNGVPDGGNTTADFTTAITGPANISVDGNKTVRSVVFDNANPVTLSGGTLTLSAYAQANIDGNPGDETVLLSGINGTLIDRNGNHTIGSTVVLNTPLVATVAQAANTLTLTGDLVTNNNDVRKAGAGAFVVKNVRTTGALAVNAGTMRIASDGTTNAVSNVATLTIAGATNAWTGQLDLTNNGMVVDNAASDVNALPAVQNQLKSGYAGGAWTGNGITSSAAAATAASAHRTALGYRASLAAGTFLGQTVDDSAVLIRYTYAGDTNLDGKVDLTDFTFLAANFNGANKNWVDGDFNYDGSVDLTDFTFLASNFNQSLAAGGGSPGSLGAMVPEPTSALGILFATAILFPRRSPHGRRRS
jgi:hypothetical protein